MDTELRAAAKPPELKDADVERLASLDHQAFVFDEILKLAD